MITSLLIIVGMVFNFQVAQAHNVFPVATTAHEVLSFLEGISKKSIIFIDIDDTLITPVSKTFRKPPYNKLIDDIKKDKSSYSNYETLLSNWRLQRKVMLIDTQWPDVLLHLKQRYSTYGLTKMDTGKFGNIESMEQWRSNELKSLGIEFSDNGLIPQKTIHTASFYNGIFITGIHSKSQTLSYYLESLKADTFVMVDDREEHLNDMRQFCEKNNITFVGILFDGLKKFTDTPNHDIALLQKRYLIEHARWLEDEEAQEMIEQNSALLSNPKR